jgi:urease accessory protein
MFHAYHGSRRQGIVEGEGAIDVPGPAIHSQTKFEEVSMRSRVLSLILIFAAPAAFAHPGIQPLNGFVAGLIHPLAGLDHLLAMVAVGFWAVCAGPRPWWRLPLAFLMTMVIGGGLGAAGVPLAGNEVAVAGSVLLLGLMIAFRAKASGRAALALVVIFALLHGHAHGFELAPGVGFGAYALGFVTGTGLLIMAGMGLGLALNRLPVTYRYVGAVIGVAGAVLLDQAI